MEKSSYCNDQFNRKVYMDSTRSEFVTNTAKLPVETVKRLIGAVAKRPSLWERSYGNNGKRRHEQNMLWLEISEEVKLSVPICRTKWGHLRDNFRKVFIRNTLSGEIPTTWRFYNDMRFMEKSLSYNILRSNHLKYQRQNYHETHVPNYETSPVIGPSINSSLGTAYYYNVDPASQQSIDNSSANTDSSINELPTFKRIKLETQFNESQSDLPKYNCQGMFMPSTNNNIPFRHEYPDSEDIPVANEPIEICYKEPRAAPNKSKSQIFTIEVFDDEEENEHESTETRHSFQNNENHKAINSKSCNSETNCDISKATNFLDDDSDTDRLFLLSLLPYLQTIPLERKLYVRQKLQSVLIDELV